MLHPASYMSSFEEASVDLHRVGAPETQAVVPFNYKYLMISFLVLKYFWEQYINFRQLRRNLIKDIPEQLRKYRISTHEFLLSQSYSFDKITFDMLSLSIRMAVDTLSIMCNLLPFIWDNVSVVFPFVSMSSEFQRAVGYTLIEAFKTKAFEVPISAYQTFVIEKKYNFTNKTIEIFIYDLLVEATLMVIIFPPIIYGYLQVVQVGGEYFEVFLQIFVICITIVLTWIHPNLIAPLFHQFTELKDAELRMKIYTIANKNSIKLSNIYVINSSVRSAHSNAYLYGLGRSKTIVLYDSLLNSLTSAEVLAVITHEMGHSHGSHSIKKLLVYLVEVFSMFYIFKQFIKNENVFISFGFTTRSVFICTALYFHMFEPLTSVFNTLLLVLTRKFQFQADDFACEQGYGEELKKSLIKLFKQSTSTVKPDVLYAWIKHSHPSIYERIESIDEKVAKEKKKYDDAYWEKNKSKYRNSLTVYLAENRRTRNVDLRRYKPKPEEGRGPAEFKRVRRQHEYNESPEEDIYSQSEEQIYNQSSSSYSESSPSESSYGQFRRLANLDK